MAAEIWREIANTDYSVSDQGRVASRWFGKWRVLKPGRDLDDYLHVSLHDGHGGRRTRPVHQLVAETFLGPKPTPKHQINHRNGIRDDPRAENLEWCTSSENHHHSFHVLGRKAAHGAALPQTKVTETDVREILRRCAEGESRRGVAVAYGIGQTNVSAIVTRKTWRWVV